MGTVGLGQHNVTPAERFRDRFGVHPALCAALGVAFLILLARVMA